MQVTNLARNKTIFEIADRNNRKVPFVVARAHWPEYMSLIVTKVIHLQDNKGKAWGIYVNSGKRLGPAKLIFNAGLHGWVTRKHETDQK